MGFSSLSVAVHLLPQCIAGIIVNIVAAMILHRVNNKLLTAVGALCYLASAILLATMKEGSSYWAFIFPSLLLVVIGADLQFNVANVSVFPSSEKTAELNSCRCMSCRHFLQTNSLWLAVFSIQSPECALLLVSEYQHLFTTPNPQVKPLCRHRSDHIMRSSGFVQRLQG